MDGGSGYDIGSRALSAVSKSHDGRGSETILVEAVTHHLGVKKPEDLLRCMRGAYACRVWRGVCVCVCVCVCVRGGYICVYV